MDLQAYRDEIRLRLTGDLLELEISDSTLDKIINSALRELQRYISSTKSMTIAFSRCIDFTNMTDSFGLPIKVSAISNIYRIEGYSSDSGSDVSISDPMYAMQWQVLGGVGNIYNYQNSILNYGAWSIMQRTKNILSTDLTYYFDKSSNKLYINASQGAPAKITIEYIPRYDSAEEITSDYWIDMLVKLSIALAKVTVGRIRTRYSEAGALWAQDGDKILAEGESELKELRDFLTKNDCLFYPKD